jgi:DNA-binding MarR family transcriptional regulator
LPIWFAIEFVDQSLECMPMPPRADVSLLFDLFVAGQRMRRVLVQGMTGSGMRPDEYAAYSLLFMHGPITATEMARQMGMPLSTVLDYLKQIHRAGHLKRSPDPGDGRALMLALNERGMAAQRRANRHWEVVRKQVEASLTMSVTEVRRTLQALDDAAAATLEATSQASTRGPAPGRVIGRRRREGRSSSTAARGRLA